MKISDEELQAALDTFEACYGEGSLAPEHMRKILEAAYNVRKGPDQEEVEKPALCEPFSGER